MGNRQVEKQASLNQHSNLDKLTTSEQKRADAGLMTVMGTGTIGGAVR